MILFNDTQVSIEHFPDGTQRIHLDVDKAGDSNIKWLYQNDEELASLIYITKHFRDKCSGKLNLWLIYVPNARMDRTHNSYEVFTLKHFAEVINWLNFDQVKILDPHSNVTPALLNRCSTMDLGKIISGVMDKVEKDTGEELVLYFPDAGAHKKYSEMFPERRSCYGQKHRDWDTGKILGLEVETNSIDLKNKVVLIIDDIVAYGGSMHFGAEKLLELGAKEVYAYCSHAEMSVLDEEKGTLLKSLKAGDVKKLFTTNSIYRGESPYIEVISL